MAAQGIFFLVHMAIMCQGNVCQATQVILDTYRNPQVCMVMSIEMHRRLPQYNFYCLQERDI